MIIPLVPFILLAYLVLYVLAATIPGEPHCRPSAEFHEAKTDLGPQLSLEAWISHEKSVALHNLLQNVAPFGSNARGAAPGTVIASPSEDHPDYFYQWIRDAAITLSTLVGIYKHNSSSTFSTETITPIMQSYASLSHKLQQTPNPSGSFDETLSGLGEPKFNIDGSPFTGNWGRPQRDGPALRALTLISWLRAYNSTHPMLWSDFVSSHGLINDFSNLYAASMPPTSVIKADLEYVAKHWNETDGFDLWEETQGMHFFTSMVQLRALKEGAELAASFGDVDAQKWYLKQADALEDAIKEQFWDEKRGFLISTVGTARSGLDCAVFLGSLHSLGTKEKSDDVYPPWSDEVLVTLLSFSKDQRKRFPINSQHLLASQSQGSDTQSPQQVLQRINSIADDTFTATGLGRYPEDKYDGYTTTSSGNPWFLCTSSASQILSLTATQMQQTRQLHITPRGLAFWRALISNNVASGVYDSSTSVYTEAMQRLRQVSDDFLGIVREHASTEGSMSEQFDGITGFERGARDLTWSYGAFLEAVRARG